MPRSFSFHAGSRTPERERGMPPRGGGGSAPNHAGC
jgi:hypothetical protein